MSKKLPGFKDIIGLYADDESDVSTVQEPYLHDFSSEQFTIEQINEYCRKIDNMYLVARSEGKLLFQSVQIIRQLQAELAGMERFEVDDLSAPVFTSPTGPEGQG